MSVTHLAGNELENLLRSSEPKLFLWKQSSPNLNTVVDVPSCGYIRTRDKEYSCAFLHGDNTMSPPVGYTFVNTFTFDLKGLMNLGLVDMLHNVIDLGHYMDPPEELNLVNHFKKHNGDSSLNNIIPLVKHIEGWQNFEFDVDREWNNDKYDVTDASHMIWNTMIPSLFSEIEYQGLSVDIEKYKERFPDKLDLVILGKVYTHYNFYTKTGRPSNAFGGINFAALNKHDGTRDVFVPENEIFVNVDFRSYHLHLIAKMVGLDLPEDPHTILAQEYFNTDSVTPEQYEESKKITFRNLYDTNIGEEVKNIEFFRRAKQFSDELYENYKRDGVVYSRSGREFTFDENLTKNKVFNYYIQMAETESNAMQLNGLMHHSDFVPCLYTYDSMVFDIQENQLDTLKKQLMESLYFPYSVEVGKTLSF